MICKNCGKEIDSNLIFCKYCGINLKDNQTKKEKKNIFKEILKNKKLLIGIISGIVLLIIMAVILTLVLTSTKKLYKAFDNMIKTDSYKVMINRNEYDVFDEEWEQELELENVVENSKEKITNSFGTRYFYNNKGIESEEYNGEEVWYYSPEYTFTTNISTYKPVYNELFSILKKYKFVRTGKTFEFKNEKYIDKDGDEWETLWDLQYDLEDVLNSLSTYSYHSISASPEYGAFKKTGVLGNIKITVKNNMISDITLVYIAECYDEDDEWLDCSKIEEDGELYNLNIKFSDLNKAKVELPKEVKEGLEKTTAGNWVGTYKGNIVCPDGNSYEETLELTDKYSVSTYIAGWDIKMKGYSCNDNYYNLLDEKYNIVDNKLIVSDIFGEILVEFEYKDGKIIEYDENKNIITTFEKE